MKFVKIFQERNTIIELNWLIAGLQQLDFAEKSATVSSQLAKGFLEVLKRQLHR